MKRNLVVAILAAIMIAVFALSFASCTKEDATLGADTGLKTMVPGVLTAGSDCTWPPMEYIEGDKIVGFDVDLTQAIADKIGLKLDYQNTAWDGLFPALIAGKFDMAISSITITDDRKKEMDFSDPYYQTDQSATVKIDSGIDSADKLNGKKAGVQIGTTGEIEARKIQGLEVNTYDDILLAFEDLKAGRVDAVIADSYVGFSYSKNNEGLEVGFSIVTDEQLGIAFAKDNPELLAAVNAALKSIKEDGTYDKIYAKWFGGE
jgi:ABC-type amino acid transport substrate-binding protein